MKQDIEVELTFLPTEHGGRKGPAFSGYRPQFYYGGSDWVAIHTYVDVEKDQPGDTVTARLSFLSPQEHVGKVFEGMPFLVREGQRVLGYGRVTRILDLEASARQSEAASGAQAKSGP